MRTTNQIKVTMLLLLASLAGPEFAAAHEFYLTPMVSGGSEGTTRICAFVGEGLEGEPIRYSVPYTDSFRKYEGAEVGSSEQRSPSFVDLSKVASHGQWTFAELPSGTGGIVSFVSRFVDHEMEGDAFNAYLAEDGLDDVLRQREQTESDGVVRERFRRSAKLYLPASQRTDVSWRRGGSEGKVRTAQGLEFASSPRVDPCVPLGLPLEIVPLTDPEQSSAHVSFQILWEGQPLEGALVRTWHRPARTEETDPPRQPDGSSHARTTSAPTDLGSKDDAGTPRAAARTTAEGTVEFDVSMSGEWLVSVVHMVPSETASSDWESTWASFTFLQR